MTGPAPFHALKMIVGQPSPVKADAVTKPEPADRWSSLSEPSAHIIESPAPTDRDDHGRFLTGNPGGGRRKGSRNKLSELFLETIASDFVEHGAEAVKRLRENDPATYLKLIGWLIPRELILKREQSLDFDLADLTDDEALAFIEAERRRRMIRNAIGPPDDR
jgi:hypothetical protein